MWHYAKHKLSDIGIRGVFAGWGLSIVKDSLGSAAFFSTFEYLKAQAYYSFVTRYYGSLQPRLFAYSASSHSLDDGVPIIKPHYALEPMFLLLAGVTASIAQQAVQHPLTLVQNIHYGRLESLDYEAQLNHAPRQMLRHYYHAYEKTFEQCKVQALKSGGMRRWLYAGFFVNTIKQVPSTSAGLIIFELVRRRYGAYSEAVKIQKDGFDILLS